jgi:hypothetical protein
MKPIGRRILVGMIIAAGSAFLWAFIMVSIRGGWENSLIVVPFWAAYAVLFSSWYVLPMGAVLGVIMPWIVHNCSVRSAWLRGALVGVGVAVIAASLTSVTRQWPTISGVATIVDQSAWRRAAVRDFSIDLISMALVCGVIVGIWAVRWRNKPSHS